MVIKRVGDYMARPTKQGLEYFALDVVMSDEVEIIEAEHGLVGFAVLIKLFQKIYSEGYYYEWEDREQILFSNRVSVDRNKVVSIVNDCIKWEIFDKQIYERYKILTSRRIQNHYFTSTYKRVNVEAIEEYLLIDVSDRNNLNVIRVSDDGNEDTNIDTDVESTQSKSKSKSNSKVKDKEKNIELQQDCNEDEIPEEPEEVKLDYEEDSTEIQLSRFMIDEMLRIKPDSKVPDKDVKKLQGWAEQIDYMLRIDKRSPRDIAELFRWSQEDSFWCSNIRSPRKLREKWDTLELQKNKDSPKSKPKVNNNLSKLEEMYRKAKEDELA